MRPRQFLPFLLVAAVLAALPTMSAAQEVAGRWVLTVELDAGSGDATFDLEVDGNQITGTYSGTLGDADVTGTVDGANVSFGFSVDQVGDITYEGTIDGDTMSGTTSYGMLGSGTFEGTRQSE